LHDDSNPHVLITGGAGDIGCAIAATLLERGFEVTLADAKSAGEARPWLDRVPGAAFRELDVRSPEATAEAVAGLPGLDAAVACAGIVRSDPFLAITGADWQAQLDVNLSGCFHLGQAAARRMVSEGTPGRIVFIGSWVGEVPWPEIAAYSVSKAGVRMLARSMARELAAHGIKVNVVAPGIVDAGLAKTQRETDPGYAERIRSVVPLGRLQTAEEVAGVTAFLCSPEADYLTGTVLLADGGCSLFQFDG
jgi:NAD(P)-dependent dehydrogenase (short-subunit alcohol dehydrogenase family)